MREPAWGRVDGRTSAGDEVAIMRPYFLPIVAALIAIPSTGLAQTSPTVEESNERLRQNYWQPFQRQVERLHSLKTRGAPEIFQARHFRMKCWENGKLRVDEENVLMAGADAWFMGVILSDGRFMMIHQSAGLCVLEEQPGPSLR